MFIHVSIYDYCKKWLQRLIFRLMWIEEYTDPNKKSSLLFDGIKSNVITTDSFQLFVIFSIISWTIYVQIPFSNHFDIFFELLIVVPIQMQRQKRRFLILCDISPFLCNFFTPSHLIWIFHSIQFEKIVVITR